MSLSRLRTFVEVYRQRSISGAARSLNLTQPAVSQHIAGLEVAVGRPLFERQSVGVIPTSAADELAADVGDKLDAAEAALSSARFRSMGVAGALQIIGHADFMAEVLTGELLPLIEAGIRVRMHTGDGPMITSMLLEGHCDLGISAHPVTDSRLQSETLLTCEVVAVASPAVVKTLVAADDFSHAICHTPLLAYNLELSLIDKWLLKNRIKTEQIIPTVISQDLRALRNLLTKGVGWSVMPEFLCREQIAKGELMEVPAPFGTYTMQYYLIWASSALRQARVAHAKEVLLQRLTAATDD
ncbi:LysR family transcriptional regulator [Marinomonas rhizomae]|uniref:DNA-binding transcriptional LysR family regulator n=1 Tax=Marinomonas rhizomae TaxID=491948 RepID=A0A366J9I2_9GAMM|nr:LysR family transcriptional regulator [Marinomonas rhizomae]RBP83603.1 DNA-binding transcriptional LysR family regulator [Marinomonas rhizomae]RNF74146.1 LysR family transcriptional regulator [Marinomonas rhizomae]